MIPTNYAQADKFLGSRNERNIPSIRSTKLVRVKHETCEEIALVYHNTSVVTFSDDGQVIVNARGYRTKTTKERINAAVPSLRVHQRNYEWFIDFNGQTQMFRDGMIVRDNVIL